MGNSYFTAMLSSLGSASVAVRCTECNRAGRYAAPGLVEAFGDLTVALALQAIAQRAGCPKALNPPSVTDIANFNDRRCKITTATGLSL